MAHKWSVRDFVHKYLFEIFPFDLYQKLTLRNVFRDIMVLAEIDRIVVNNDLKEKQIS